MPLPRQTELAIFEADQMVPGGDEGADAEPEPEEEEEPAKKAADGQTTEISIAPSQQIRVADHNGTPKGDVPYTLELSDGTVIAGNTDEDGWTEGFDPKGIDSATLTVGDQAYEITFVDQVGDSPTDTQSLLNGAGFEAGPLDGDLGPQTKAAIEAFQRSAGLEQTGEADEETISLLRKRNGLPADDA